MKPVRGARYLVTATLLISACQAAAPSPTGPIPVAIPTAEPRPAGQMCEQALLTGVLAADEDAGVVVQAADGTSRVVVWPNGWVAVDWDGMRVLLNHRGDPVARVGDRMQIGGGEGGGRWNACGTIERLP